MSIDLKWIPPPMLIGHPRFRLRWVWDFDDVLFSWRAPFTKFVKQQRDVDLLISANYELVTSNAGTYTREEFERDLLAFAKTGGFYKRVKNRHVDKAMAALDQAGITNCIWTATPGTDSYLAWLGRELGQGDPQFSVFELVKGINGKKGLPVKAQDIKFIGASEKAAALVEGGYVGIADNDLVTTLMVRQQGLLPICVSQPDNEEASRLDGIIRESDLLVIAEQYVIPMFEELERLGLVLGRRHILKRL